MVDGKLLVEKLLVYSKKNLYLNEIDEIYFRNYLLSKFQLVEPYSGNYDFKEVLSLDVPDILFEECLNFVKENNLCEEGKENNFVTNIFGELTPLPSKINEEFNRLKREKGPIEACNYLYNLSIKNYYIQKTAISKNLKWDYHEKNSSRYVEVTINLSKPEKNNKDIAKLLTVKQDKKYPDCLLCKENEGFEGTFSHPARRNIRTIKVNLNNEKWFMQYSPYAYYNEHCIVINENHIPMNIDASTPKKLLDFIDFLPNYFIGSNASLPIVGGSILNHEHFQGGLHLMPMHHAKIKEFYTHKDHPNLKVGILDWYNSAIQIEGENKKEIEDLAGEIIEAWKNYSDLDNDILAYSEDKTPHNTVSPIARKENNKYIFTLILRNNNTSEKYPDGIFHVHPEYQNIKKEGIGLIEAMGLFILPGRLKRQLDEIANILCGNTIYNEKEINNENHDLFVHKDMIKDLLKDGLVNSKDEATKKVTDYVNNVCVHILENTAVFKENETGKKGFENFLKTLNFNKISC